MTQLEGIYLKKEDKSKRKFGIREKTLLSIFLFNIYCSLIGYDVYK